jgi:hypothetical protein
MATFGSFSPSSPTKMVSEDALSSWVDLYINTVNGTDGGGVRFSNASITSVNYIQVLVAKVSDLENKIKKLEDGI